MKKFLLLIGVLAACLNAATAGSGGPDAYGYTWKDSNEPGGPVFAWWDIATTGTPVTGLADDNVVGPFGIGGGFQYYWYQPEFFWIGSNGYISFNNGNIASPFPNIPLPAGVNDFIAPLLADLNFQGAGNLGQCFYKVSGDSIGISWINAPYWSQTTGFTGSNSFQIILNRVDKSITFNYLSMTGTTQGNDISVGIENITGNLGLQAMRNAYPTNNYCIKFYYPPVVTYAVTDAGIRFNDNSKNGGKFVSVNGPSAVYSTTVRNYGNQMLSNFNVSGQISRGANVVNLGSVAISSLAPGVDTQINFPTAWTATSSGTYVFSTTIGGLTGDMFQSNNHKRLKIVAIDTNTSPVKLDYSDGLPNGAGLNWAGGLGGIGVYVQPSFYPAKVLGTRFCHSNNTGGAGFTALIYKDDGPNGSPGTLLDSVNVPGSQVLAGAYTVVPLNTPGLTLTSGGVYVVWDMRGANITLARDTTSPISGRTYEILGGIWADYRARDQEDFLMGLDVERISVNDLSVPLVTSPQAGVMPVGNTPVSIWLKNLGNTQASGFTIGYRAGARNPVTQIYTGNPINPGDSLLFTFNVPLSPIGLPSGSNFCVWANMPADSNAANDTNCFVLGSTVGVSSLTLGGFKLYPNPVKAHQPVSMSFEKGTLTQAPLLASVMDMQGRVIWSNTFYAMDEDSGIGITSLPEMAPGIYQVILKQGQAFTRQSLVVVP